MTYIVDRLTDANPSGGGEGSGLAGDLRYGITNAQSGDRITFSVTGMINLAGALPSLTRNIRIQGPGANSLTVHGAGGSVFAVANGTTVVLSDLTITGGAGNGGGIFNGGTLTLNGVTISGNVAGDPTNGGGTGAGLWNYVSATLILNNCTVSGNSVIGNLSYNPSRGGGIANYGTLTLNNSTVSGNSAAQGFGGGISNSLNTSTLRLNNSTVSDNSATGAGGGIDNHGTFTARNTIIAGNTNSDLSGLLTSQGHNLLGNTTGSSGFDPTDLLNVNPLLTALGNYGGPTQVHALKAGSPAIDAGDNTGCLATDQRGVMRPLDGNGDGSAICDIGAYESIPGVLVFVPVMSITIQGPTSGITNTDYVFTATVLPITATIINPFTWSPAPDAGQGTMVVTYAWPTTGIKTISVTTMNAGGAVGDTHTIILFGAERHDIYLPLILR